MSSSRIWSEVAHPYQINSCNQLLTKRNWCLFLDPGMGKTSTVLRALLQIKQTVGYKKTLIMGPLRVISKVWPDEIAAWDEFKELRAEVFHGRNPLEIRDSTADIILINFEYLEKMHNFCHRYGPKTIDKFTRCIRKFYGLDGLVIDELTAFKNTDSLRYKILSRNVEGFEFRWGLTGTPVANSLMHIFGQAHVIDCGEQFGKYITHFRNKYFYQDPINKYIYNIKNDECKKELYAKISNIGTRLSATDYLDLPDVVENKIFVTLSKESMKLYRQMQEKLVITLNDKTITAFHKMSEINKCRQIASGFIYSDTSTEEIHTCKIDALYDLVEEMNGKPLLVFINFRSEADVLKKKFPYSEVIYGGTSTKDSDSIISRWNSGDVKLLIAHPATMAHGINLQAGGNHVCWYTLPWDLEQYEQGNRRIFRQGQKSDKVFYHKILAENTIDSYMNHILNKKITRQEELFNFLKDNLAEGQHE